jgi:hypothetical protein
MREQDLCRLPGSLASGQHYRLSRLAFPTGDLACHSAYHASGHRVYRCQLLKGHIVDYFLEKSILVKRVSTDVVHEGLHLFARLKTRTKKILGHIGYELRNNPIGHLTGIDVQVIAPGKLRQTPCLLGTRSSRWPQKQLTQPQRNPGKRISHRAHESMMLNLLGIVTSQSRASR